METSPLRSCRRLSQSGERGVNITVHLEPDTQNPLSSSSPGCWLHGTLTEHFLAPAVPGIAAAFWAGLDNAEGPGVKSAGEAE